MTPTNPFGNSCGFLYLCVYLCFVNKFICMIFLNSSHKWYHMTFVFFRLLTSLHMIISRSVHVAANGIISFLLWLSNSPLPRWLSHKESTWQCRRCRFGPWVGKIPWSRKWQLIAVFLPRKLYIGVTEKLTGLQSTGSQRITQDWAHIYRWVVIYPPIYQWSCFHVLGIVNSAAVSIEVCVSFWISVLFSVYMFRNEIAGSYGSSIFSFWGTCILFSRVAVPIYIPTNYGGESPSLHTFSSI